MSLRYSFRHLFYGGKIQKERLYKVLEDLDTANGGESTDIGALKTTVGDSSSGLVKDVADLKNTVGGNDSGLTGDLGELAELIGDSTNPAEGTILYRLAQLETDDTEPSG